MTGRIRTNHVLAAVIALALTFLMLAGAPSASADPTDAPPSGSTEPPPPSEPPPSESTEPPPPSEPPPPTDPPPTPSEPSAEPPPFSEQIDAASQGHEALAADAMRLSRLVVDTELRLAQLELEAEAAADVYRRAEADLAEANARAGQTRATAVLADLRLRIAEDALTSFARDTYINSSSELATQLLLLDSRSPADLIERAGLLELVAVSRTEAIDRVLSAQAASARADAAATAALEGNREAEAAARTALAQSTALLAAQQSTLPSLLQQKAGYEADFYASLVDLLGQQGADAAFADYEHDQQVQYAAEAAARAAAYDGGPVLSGSWALPLTGTFTSCFCERWGTMHWGIDIAAPIYTPEYAAGDGTVLQAGAATGFGQAVYIQHDNGDVTVYGHMEVIEVVAGQRVVAGQEIALVGMQGFSTGPHLHFEVHVGGIDGIRVDPVAWLAQRGIFV